MDRPISFSAHKILTGKHHGILSFKIQRTIKESQARFEKGYTDCFTPSDFSFSGNWLSIVSGSHETECVDT
jgi:hypothetical protein